MMVLGVGCCVMSSQAEAASVSLNLGKDVKIVFSDNGVRLKNRVVQKKKMVKKDFRRNQFLAKNKRVNKGKVKRRCRC